MVAAEAKTLDVVTMSKLDAEYEVAIGGTMHVVCEPSDTA